MYKVYHIALWIKTDRNPMTVRERILDLCDDLNVECDFSDPILDEHEMPSDSYPTDEDDGDPAFDLVKEREKHEDNKCDFGDD